MAYFNKQFIFYALLLICLIVTLPFIYLHFHQDVVLFRKAQNALKQEDYDKAIDHFIQAQKAGLNSINLLQDIGQSYMNMGRFDLAEDIYKELISKSPQDVNFKYQLAIIFFVRKKYDQALRLVKGLQNNVEPIKQVMFLKARILTAMGLFDLAISTYKQILGEK